MPVPTGATLEILSQSNLPNGATTILKISGTYTAADFTLKAADGLGFDPSHVLVLNLADGNQTEGYNGETNGVKTVAAGTRTIAPHGVTFGKGRIDIAVAVAGPITDNATVIIEARR